jgi:hypothetical protein
VKRRIRFVLGASLLALPCFAQTTPAEQMQKAIYEEETAGSLDSALQIYRQIVAGEPVQSPLALQAQYRLAQALLKKGDVASAAAEFSALAARYPDRQELFANFATNDPARGSTAGFNQRPAGTLGDGRFTFSRSGLAFAVPSGWKLVSNGMSSGGGDMVTFSDGSPTEFGVWMRPELTKPADIPQKLSTTVTDKAKDNPTFVFRPEGTLNRTVAGQRALSAIADYTRDGKSLSAYYIWSYTEKVLVQFFARSIPAADLPAAQAQVDALAATAIVP